VRLLMSDPDGVSGESRRVVTVRTRAEPMPAAGGGGFSLFPPHLQGGAAGRVVTVRTRAERMPAAGGRVFHVYPHDFKGAKTEPSFEGLMCAYNFWCAGTDWATSGRPRVQGGAPHPV